MTAILTNEAKLFSLLNVFPISPSFLLFCFKIPAVSLQEVLLEEEQQQQEREAGQRNSL